VAFPVLPHPFSDSEEGCGGPEKGLEFFVFGIPFLDVFGKTAKIRINHTKKRNKEQPVPSEQRENKVYYDSGNQNKI
jgi:hypothetical protein